MRSANRKCRTSAIKFILSASGTQQDVGRKTRRSVAVILQNKNHAPILTPFFLDLFDPDSPYLAR